MSLIQNGANVNAVGEDGRTALIANADLGKNLYLLFRQNFEIVEKKNCALEYKSWNLDQVNLSLANVFFKKNCHDPFLNSMESHNI